MPTICPRCYKAIGETPWCGLCRKHNDKTQQCGCPECEPDSYIADAMADNADERDPNEGSRLTGCWCPEGHCTCDAADWHRREMA